ncbi:MAG: ribosome-binding factor A [Candidatus Fraserbacteria bacterium RBG_16_55_9]|uniref:Ribosome-binding factor A n=1 Tax=Fraserbacteria sp. (strain RBG_16_55_9) TaxID=1817864 RepID=A0A1F5UWY8_FRAXR|nr:MAG: ribosome-binding factor A [Candidatus Fraserbacteria bacterium RBG_16_55_9]
MGRKWIARVREEIKRRLSEILEFGTRDPRLELVTVMDVRISSDLNYATIYVSVTGREASEEEAIKVLNEHRGFFRSELAKRLTLRHTPELRFELDLVEKRARRIEEVLREEGSRNL